MSYATRNENGDNMGNTFVRAPLEISKEEFGKRWDKIFGAPSVEGIDIRVVAHGDGSIPGIEEPDRPWLGA